MKLIYLFFITLFLSSCQTESQETTTNTEENPAAEGFNLIASDPTAIEIADQVMKAMGGRKNWNATRYLAWNFFGRRQLFWDKHTGDVQINFLDDSMKVYLNVQDTTKGKVYQNEIAMTEADSIKKYVAQGRSTWINDSYWLVMPYKLKDSGVTLKYKGKDTLQTGVAAETLELTFNQVGDTPQNRYVVYVTPNDSLVKQWDFYREAQDTVASFSTPWEDYEKYGNIMLSGNRGRGQLTEIAVYDELPASFEWLK